MFLCNSWQHWYIGICWITWLYDSAVSNCCWD